MVVNLTRVKEKNWIEKGTTEALILVTLYFLKGKGPENNGATN